MWQIFLFLVLRIVCAEAHLNHHIKQEPEQSSQPAIYFPLESSKQYTFQQKIEPIPDTDLYSGIFYKLKIARYPDGIVSWTNQTDHNGANFVHLNLNPEITLAYKDGEERDFDDQWILNFNGQKKYFTIQNKGLSIKRNCENVLSWNKEEADPGGVHVVLYSNPEYLKQADGRWKDEALWKAKRVGKNHYKLINKEMKSGTFTWSFKHYGEYSHCMQIDNEFNHAENYEFGGEWFADAAFTFTPVQIKLGDRIYSINPY